MRLTFQFSLTTVTLTNHCTYPNFPEGFKVEVRSTADVDPSRINIHTPQQKTGKKRNGPTDYECNVSLQQGTIDYKMNGNSLTIYDRHTGEELILKRL
jgi:hypothetical protein